MAWTRPSTQLANSYSLTCARSAITASSRTTSFPLNFSRNTSDAPRWRRHSSTRLSLYNDKGHQARSNSWTEEPRDAAKEKARPSCFGDSAALQTTSVVVQISSTLAAVTPEGPSE